MLQKTHPGTCFGLPQGWAQPGLAQPCSFSLFTSSQGFSQPGWARPGMTSSTGFSEEMQHFCTQLLSPHSGRSGLGPLAAPLQGIWAGQ